MKTKILSLGNIYFEIDSLKFPIESGVVLNKEYVGSEYMVYAGSSALTFARIIKSLGLEPSFIGKMGKDILGQIVDKMLVEEGIEFNPIVSYHHQTNLALNFMTKNGRGILFSPGTANQSMEPHEVERMLSQLLPKVEYLYLGGVFKLKKLIPALSEIIDLAKKFKVKIALDHNRLTNATSESEKRIMKELIPKVDYYLPSFEELPELLGAKSLTDATKKIAGMTSNPVVIKNGENGAIGISDGEVIEIPAFRVRIHNTVGAGDSFNAGFIRARVEGLGFEESIRFANGTAALKISGNLRPSFSEVKKLCLMN